MEINVLTTTLKHLVGVLSHGQAAVTNLQGNVLQGLAIIEIALAACWIALDASNMSSIFKKILNLGFWIFFARQFGSLAFKFCDSLVQIGLGAGGSSGSFGALLDPSEIAGRGLDVTAPLVKLLDTLGITDFKHVLVFSLAYLFIMACYISMALQVFLAVIEFYIIVTLAGALIPFGISSHTKFLAEKAIGAVVAASIKMMVLAFMLGAIGPTLSSIKFAGAEITLNELMAVVLSSAAMAFLVWTAPSLASGLLAGSPSLSAAGITQSVAAVSASATGMAGGLVGSVRTAQRVFSGSGNDKGGGGGTRGGTRGATSTLLRGAADGYRGARDSSHQAPSWAAAAGSALGKE